MTAPTAPIQPGRRTTLRGGPWTGVRDTDDPFDDDWNLLVDAVNCYIPDPTGGSGTYSRPGFVLLNGGTAVFTSASAFRGQAIYTHIALNGTAYNFTAFGGSLFRVDDTLTVFTNVTPVGVTINGGIGTRLQFVSLGDELGVSDGVNRPWTATNLASTPITGTYIDYDGAGVDWTVQHWVVWGGAIVAILKTLNSVYRQTDIAWSEPGQMTVGWQQTDFDNNWTLEQTGSTPIYALAPTNVALYYFRQRSIGAISGTIGPDLATTSTHDAVSFNVGTEAPQSIQQFGNSIFFTDTIGRPWMLPIGVPPVPIWQNMRAKVDAAQIAYPTVTAITTTSAFEPTLNLYLVAIWSPTPSVQAPPVQVFVFDAHTGMYCGRWIVGSGIAVECLGVFADSHGRAVLMVSGSKLAAPSTGGYLWSFNSLTSLPDLLATEGGSFLTTEGGLLLTTEGQESVWTDNGVVPTISATTQRFGYSSDMVWNVDQCVIVSDSSASVVVTMTTPTGANTAQGTPSSATSQDDTYRLVCGANAVGRGVKVTVSPTSAGEQWSLEQVEIIAVPSRARPEDA